MLRKLMLALFVGLLLVGCTVAEADTCNHVYDFTSYDYSYIAGYTSLGASNHKKIIHYVEACMLCGGAQMTEVEYVVEQHNLISDNYHNGDQTNHVYRTYCIDCDYYVYDLRDCDCPPGTWNRKSKVNG